MVRNKKTIFLGLLLLVVVSVLFFPKVARAELDDAIARALSWVLLGLTDLVGKLVIVVVRLLVSVAQYNDFVNSPAVSIGWIVIRDICNMFFVLALLVIAFCSVLGIQQYSYKKALGGLILAVILVNFSKLILGFVIDVSQVVMLTFVNAFSAAGEGNFAEMFGLRQLLDPQRLGPGAGITISSWEIFWAAGLALILSIVALVVSIVITILLVFRIVILWFLVLFSPLPFLMGLFPQTSEYAKKFWGRFTSQVIIGPILAFCLWLSLAVVQQSVLNPGGLAKGTMGENVYQSAKSGAAIAGVSEAPAGAAEQKSTLSAAVSRIGESSNILSFVIGIVMLIGSLSMAQQVGAEGGEMAKKVSDKMQNWGKGAARLPGRAIGAVARGTVKGAAERIEAATGIPIQPSTIKREWQDAMTRQRWSREAKRKMKRTQLSTQIEAKGWPGGIRDYARDVLGVGKRKIKGGKEKIEEAKKYAEGHISESDTRVKREELKDKRQKLQDTYVRTFDTKRIDKKIAVNKLANEATAQADKLKTEGKTIEAMKLKAEAISMKGAAERNEIVDLDKFKEIDNFYKQSHPEIDSLTAAIKSLEETLKRKPVHDNIWAERYTKQTEEGKRLMSEAKRITEPVGSYERRAVEDVLIREKMKELPETYDQQEFIALARQFEEKGDLIRFKAVMTKMVENGDINEPILHDEEKEKQGFNTATTEGWDKWSHFLAEKFKTPLEDIRRALHEWCNMAMYAGQDRMASPYIYDRQMGDLRLTTPEEFKQQYLYFMGMKEQEKRTRNVGKMGHWGEAIGPDGKRQPVFDEVAKLDTISSIPSWEAEINRRFNKDKLYYAGCPVNIEFMITRVLPDIAPRLSPEEKNKFIKLVGELKTKWEDLGRPNPGGIITIPAGSLAGRLDSTQREKIEKELGISLAGLV